MLITIVAVYRGTATITRVIIVRAWITGGLWTDVRTSRSGTCENLARQRLSSSAAGHDARAHRVYRFCNGNRGASD